MLQIAPLLSHISYLLIVSAISGLSADDAVSMPTHYGKPPNRPSSTSEKNETPSKPAGRYGSPMVGKYGFLRKESAVFGLISATVIHFWPTPTARLHVKNPIQHQTFQVNEKYETPSAPAGRYGSPRIGKYGFWRQDSAVFA